MATPEHAVKAAVKRLLKERGIWHFSPVSNGMGVHGIPDFLCCWNGRFFAIECKAPGKRHNTTGLQDFQIAQIHKSGGSAIVVDDVSQLQEVLDAKE
jgi:hypothetical protein